MFREGRGITQLTMFLSQSSFNELVNENVTDFEMTVEEAILQMEMLGHTFFMYRDGDTGEIDVVYKRRDGKYGVLEPEG